MFHHHWNPLHHDLSYQEFLRPSCLIAHGVLHFLILSQPHQDDDFCYQLVHQNQNLLTNDPFLHHGQKPYQF
ncbi:unnamed protein product [Brassica napus]|uniref:(rape) hypothetical protein n=1 Tax=Brassica napus TaxID=3708 RepID=A0A816J771_BRANA|nr:unnamed protein product [Brassica napus]